MKHVANNLILSSHDLVFEFAVFDRVCTIVQLLVEQEAQSERGLFGTFWTARRDCNPGLNDRISSSPSLYCPTDKPSEFSASEIYLSQPPSLADADMQCVDEKDPRQQEPEVAAAQLERVYADRQENRVFGGKV